MVLVLDLSGAQSAEQLLVALLVQLHVGVVLASLPVLLVARLVLFVARLVLLAMLFAMLLATLLVLPVARLAPSLPAHCVPFSLTLLPARVVFALLAVLPVAQLVGLLRALSVVPPSALALSASHFHVAREHLSQKILCLA